MAVSVLIRFPIPHEKAREVYATQPELMNPIFELIMSHGMLSHQTLLGDGEFIDIDTFPSREAHAAFKAAAAPHITAYEKALGVTSVETVWDVAELPEPDGI